MVQRTRRYLIRRVVVVLLTLFVVTLLSFLLMRLSPIDPATAYVKRNSAIVTQEQIDELKAHQDDINYDVAEKREKEVRHDVMSHVYAFGVQCPKAKPIIHLGATSCLSLIHV